MKRRIVQRYASVVILVTLILTACGPATPELVPTEERPTIQPTTALPTSTPPPTVTPPPLPPPRLQSHSPEPGEQQPPDAPIVLTFDQPMDHASVEAAWTIAPSVQGTFSWTDERTVAFAAMEPLERGIGYQVALDSSAQNIEGTPLVETITFDFMTVGHLSVSQTIPAPGSDELDLDTAVTVIFDRPVVPLTTISRQAELPQPLTLIPPVQGEGEWLNTSIYVFRPSPGLSPATRYKARIAAGLTDTSGGILNEDYTWEFTTIRPAILEVRPSGGHRYVGPTDVISVTFNQPMDHASVQSSFSLQTDGQPVDGTFRWSSRSSTPNAPETLLFQPAEPLTRDTAYVARIRAGAQARVGNIGTLVDKTWRFSTVSEPGIVSTSPRDGAEDVDPSGSLQIVFASPMEREGFLTHLTMRPEVTTVYTYWSEYDTEVQIYFPRDPDTAYSLTLDADTPDRYGATLGEAAEIRFATGDLAPLATLNTGGQLGTFSAYTDTVVYALHRNVSRLDFSLYSLSPRTFMLLNSDWQSWDEFAPSETELMRQWSEQIKVPRNQLRLTRLDLSDSEDGTLPPGLYYLELSAPEAQASVREYRPARFMFVKSQLSLTLKQTRGETLVWATDLASGQPVAGLPVALYSRTTRLDTAGSTGVDGVFVARDLAIKDLWEAFFAMTGEPGDEGFGFAYNGWAEGISPWDFDVESEFWGSSYQAHLYTDRPIYRPGQTVYFKGIIRTDDDARYDLPEEIQNVPVQVSDPRGKTLYRENVHLNDMGTLFDELLLDAEAPLGTYYIEIRDEEQELFASSSFLVAEYRKPEFQVSVVTDRSAYLSGETLSVSAEAAYYFGGPVANARVHWSVLSSDYWFQYPCPLGQSCPWYSWTDFESEEPGQDLYYGSYGRLVAEGDATTDQQGRLTFRVPAEVAQDAGSQTFTLEVSVTDISGQQVSNRTQAIVHKGEFYIGIAPRSYLAEVGEQEQVDILSVDWDGEPLARVPLTVVFMEHRWYSVREQSEDGNFYWTWTSQDTPVLTTTVTTGTDGRATAAFSPEKAGSYRIRAIGMDKGSNTIRSSTYLWVWGGEDYVPWRRESNNRINLIADKQEYQIGDIAEVMIPSPYTGTVQALVTIERGHILDTEVRTLESNSEVLRLPITEEHVPNVFVSVILVQGSEQAPDGLASFKVGLVKLPVSVEAKELTITLTPDKDLEQGQHYGPRQTANYEVLATDHDGKPVEAELSLRLADLAVLSLADEPGPTLMERFWRSRGIGVRTSTPLVVAMERYNREIAPEAKGGGGGDEGGLLRTRFADTAYWNPVVRTDRNGRATVSVTLPDNLTTWRMQAQGITADTEVGQADVDIMSSLDLMVQPVLPRFFVAGDRSEIACIVHNNTPLTIEAEVNISAEGLELASDARQVVNVPAESTARVLWPVEIPPGLRAGADGTLAVRIRMWATAGDLYDGRGETLPVYRYSTPEVMATAGSLAEPGLRQEIIQLPGALDPNQGELTVETDGSLTASALDALDYLTHYPYECVEQTVSRFLPNVVTWAALGELGMPVGGSGQAQESELRQKLAEMVGIGLQRLYAQQHYDGGWGWWVSDESDPYLTAYVIQGMLEAQRAGFLVDEEVLSKASGFLRDGLPSVSQLDAQPEANRLAYLLYILAEYESLSTSGSPANGEQSRGGKAELGLAIRLFEKRNLLSRYGQATLAMALSLLEPDEPERVRTLLSDLIGDAVLSASGAHWEEEKPDYWNMNTDIRTTAIVLWALARLQSEETAGAVDASELLANAVRWLMGARTEGHWDTTQTTAWSLLGLVAYMQLSGELAADYSYSIYLNGEELASVDVSPEDLDHSQAFQVELGRLLVEEGNRLVIERHPARSTQTGEGMLYYSSRLRYYVSPDLVQAQDRGILLARQYSRVDNRGNPMAQGAVEYVDTAQVGDLIKVKLTLIAPTDLYYVVVEDPLPAGFEGVDLGLKTTSVVGEAPELRNVTAAQEDQWLRWYGWGWWWFSHSEMRDEKVVLFATYLPRGTYEYTYLIRAGVPGEFLIIPATAYQMYFPEAYGRSDGGKFTIEPAD